jgi:hypothetical protein
MADVPDCPSCEKAGFETFTALYRHHAGAHTRKYEERFWLKVEKDANDRGCWEWRASTESTGYGQVHINGSDTQSHRYSWKVHNGDPGEQWVLHKCDNRLCVNPDHLYLGDASDNMDDMWERSGRDEPEPPVKDPQGESNGRSKLTENDVREIRRRWPDETQQDLADEFGLKQASVSQIVRRENWDHID